MASPKKKQELLPPKRNYKKTFGFSKCVRTITSWFCSFLLASSTVCLEKSDRSRAVLSVLNNQRWTPSSKLREYVYESERMELRRDGVTVYSYNTYFSIFPARLWIIEYIQGIFCCLLELNYYLHGSNILVRTRL